MLGTKYRSGSGKDKLVVLLYLNNVTRIIKLNLGEVEDRLKQNEDQIKHIDDTIDGLHKTVAILEGRHVETVEKMKEGTVLAKVKEFEQGSNNLNQIRDPTQDSENQNGTSNQKTTRKTLTKRRDV